jgi:hypothetical protein
MARIVRFYRDELPELPDASGYHDPVTDGFVASTQLLRKRRDVPDHCFDRGRAEGSDAARGPRIADKGRAR